MKIRIYKDPELSSIVFIYAYILLNEINALIQNLFTLSDRQYSFIRNTIMVILAVLIIYMVISMPKTRLYSFILVEILMVFLYLYSYVLGVSFSLLSEWMITTLPVCVPIMFAALQIKDFDYFYNGLVKLSWILLILLILDMMGGIRSSSYDMHFSYGLLLVLLIHINSFIDGKRVYSIFVVMEILILLAYGSRGALVGIAVFIVFRIAFSNIRTYRKIIYSIIIAVAVAFIFVFINNYGSMLIYYLSEMGFSSRTLRLIMNGEFISHNSGRTELWSEVLSLIQERPITGWGIRGAINEMKDIYPHNLFLDLWLSFGIPIGTVVIVALIWYLLRCFIVFHPGRKKDIFLIFFSHAMVSLMFSGTVFTNYYFFILLGFMFNKYGRVLNDNKRATIKSQLQK